MYLYIQIYANTYIWIHLILLKVPKLYAEYDHILKKNMYFQMLT